MQPPSRGKQQRPISRQAWRACHRHRPPPTCLARGRAASMESLNQSARSMFCRTCGKTVSEKAMACMACGSAPKQGNKFCGSCGSESNPTAVLCLKCGVSLLSEASPGQVDATSKSRLTAGLLNLLLPFIAVGGVGRMYLGYTQVGVWQLIITLVTCGIGGLWPFIDGIMILCGKPAKDAQGKALR